MVTSMILRVRSAHPVSMPTHECLFKLHTLISYLFFVYISKCPYSTYKSGSIRIFPKRSAWFLVNWSNIEVGAHFLNLAFRPSGGGQFEWDADGFGSGKRCGKATGDVDLGRDAAQPTDIAGYDREVFSKSSGKVDRGFASEEIGLLSIDFGLVRGS